MVVLQLISQLVLLLMNEDCWIIWGETLIKVPSPDSSFPQAWNEYLHPSLLATSSRAEQSIEVDVAVDWSGQSFDETTSSPCASRHLINLTRICSSPSLNYLSTIQPHTILIRTTTNRQNVLGRIQKECQPRNDAGYDEDRSCWEDQWQRLRSWGKVEWSAVSKSITDTFRRYRTMESAANRLQKEAKGYLDSLRGTTTQREIYRH